ncbi:MAG: hypothetical protein O3A00_21150, partial [Planctomycetota bacterium]|nr:hypothetical protein [Planctomycetota bacterium]
QLECVHHPQPNCGRWVRRNQNRHKLDARSRSNRRLGAATLDWILVVGIILPMAAFVIPMGKRIIQLVYEMTCVWVSSPFM